MLTLLVLVALTAPSEWRMPRAAVCPDAAMDNGTLSVVYGDGTNGWFVQAGGEKKIRFNSDVDTVQAAGERGPKLAVGEDAICAAWQGDYRQGPKVWFARSIDHGKTFEPQRNLIDGATKGLDHVAVAARGKQVAVFWLDARGGEDAAAPVTSTIWYSVSTDSGKTFGPNMQVKADRKIRACACCSFAVQYTTDDRATIVFRSGIRNVRDIWEASGSPTTNTWEAAPITKTGWVYEGCPMDGPRMNGTARAYTIDGNCYASLAPTDKPTLLGRGKYPNVLQSGLAMWQDGTTLNWRNLKTGETGMIPAGTNRAALISGPRNYPVIVH